MMVGPVGPLQDVIRGCEEQFKQTRPECVWIPDHLIGNNLHPKLAAEIANAPEEFSFDYWHDPFVMAAGMAGRAGSPAEFGIGVTDFIRRGPVDIARGAATLSQLLQRPLLLGVGAGETENVVPADYVFPKKPVSHFERCVSILRSIFDTGHYQSEKGYDINLGYNELPAQIWVGGQRPRMLRITAQYGDGWFPAWRMSAAEYADKVSILTQKAAEFDRPRPQLGMLICMIIGRSREQILETLDKNPLSKLWALQASGEAWDKHGHTHPFGDLSKGMFDVMIRDLNPEALRVLATKLPPEIIDEVFFLGNGDELIEQIQGFADAGLERAVLTRNFVDLPENEEEAAFEANEYEKIADAVRAM